MSTLYLHDPQAVLDYQFDWVDDPKGPWLDLANSETITAFSITVPLGLTLGNGTTGGPAPVQAAGKVTYWLSGGTVGKTYLVVCHITTSAGRQDDRTMQIAVQNR